MKIKRVDGSKTPKEGIILLKSIEHKLPEMATWILKALAYEAVALAKGYLRGKNSPPEPWEPLWQSEDFGMTDKTLGKWTPEWNLSSRKKRRNDDHPLLDTGELADSIGMTAIFPPLSIPGEGTVWVGTPSKKAAMHEYGSKKMIGHNPLPNHEQIPPRPFLNPAVDHVLNDPQIRARLKLELTKAIRRLLKGNKTPGLPRLKIPH